MLDRIPDEERTPGAVHRWEMRHCVMDEDMEGFAPLWVSSAFLHGADLRDGRLIIGDCAFHGLLIDVNWLDADALIDIDHLAEAGLPIVLLNEPRKPGRTALGDFNSTLKRLLLCSNVVRELRDAGLKPLVTGDLLPPFWARRTNDRLYLFFAHPQARSLKYPMSFGQSLCGGIEVRHVVVDFEEISHEIDLEFRPYQSILVAIDRERGVQFVDITYQPPQPATTV